MTLNTSGNPFPIADGYLGWTIAEIPVYTGFEFEKIHMDSWGEYIVQKRHFAFYTGAVYIAVIFGLQRYMRDRKALDLRLPLLFWNSVLGIFSIAAFIRSTPGFVSVISQPNGLYNSICVKKGMDIPTIYWAMLFTLSKFVELGDTVFIVLRKRPLIFLQWYHHLATLWAVWLTIPLAEPIVRWYFVLNTCVHSLMYPYFALRTIGLSIPAPLVNLITTLQFTQMLVGFCVNTSSWYFYSAGHNCVRYPASINFYIFLYGSFIFLFGKLFNNSVIKGGRKLRVKKE